jgi:hypothetical protein
LDSPVGFAMVEAELLAAALAMTNRNANRQASVLCQMSIAWLHAEAFDFEGARNCCEETLDSAIEANPFVFFLGRNLLAKACLGLQDFPAAYAQFAEIIQKIEVEGNKMETTIYPHFHYNLCEYWLATGVARAREQATWLYEIAAGPPEGTYLALSTVYWPRSQLLRKILLKPWLNCPARHLDRRECRATTCRMASIRDDPHFFSRAGSNAQIAAVEPIVYNFLTDFISAGHHLVAFNSTSHAVGKEPHPARIGSSVSDAIRRASRAG